MNESQGLGEGVNEDYFVIFEWRIVHYIAIDNTEGEVRMK
jgi:hypothetical protein